MGKKHQPDAMPGYALPRYAYRTPPEISTGKPGSYPVVIVGAGLGGLTAALELSSRGVEVVVLDDDDTVGAAGLSSRGICYAKRSLEILDRFGAAARIHAKGVTWNEGDVFRGEERLYRFNLQPETDQKFPAFVNLQQFYVEQYLVEALQKQGSADLRWKNEVVDVVPGKDFVLVKIDSPDGPYALKARYVIAADGAHSVVRRTLKAKDAEAALYDTAWCIADVRLKSSEAAVRKAYLDHATNEGGAIWYHQMADGVWRTDWQISHYPDPDAEATPARARQRLKKLLGPGVDFELVWVGAWRFRRRWLQKLVHGRVFFMGDAAAQHSPFGARGGNRAIQDANNLAWKLAMVLAGDAPPALLESYESERHPAACEAVEVASRSALFIAPESPGQHAVRNAMLDLAQRHEWARALVNVGRLSVACCYDGSPLNTPDQELNAPLARPGAAAPDGALEDGFLVERLQGQFTVAYFGHVGPSIDGVQKLNIKRGEATKTLFEHYGVPEEGATYLFRPDGHVIGRWIGMAGAAANTAIEHARRGGKVLPFQEFTSTHARDRLYDAFAEYVDEAKGDPQAMARLAVSLARTISEKEVLEAIQQAKTKTVSPSRPRRGSAASASAASRRRGSRRAKSRPS